MKLGISRAGAGRKRTVATTAAVALAGAGVVVLALSGPPGQSGPVATCAQRVFIVDTSSAARSPELLALMQQTIEAGAMSAVVCGDNIAAYGVSGGGEVSPIVTTDDLQNLTPIGPTPQLRAARFSTSQRDKLDKLITHRLQAAYKSADPTVTSVAAMYAIAAQQSTATTQVIILTTGVNEDSTVNLNRPLGTGEGATLAEEVQVPQVSAQQITIVGIAQVDSSVPPPSQQWPQQIFSFNQQVCKASGASQCRLFDLASVTQILDS
jgi:hypothetical protein